MPDGIAATDSSLTYSSAQLEEIAIARIDVAPLANTALYQALWSLAQHYELSTALVDLTYSLEVAAWFASQPWDDGAEMPPAGSIGVIYRIHGSRLRQVLHVVSSVQKMALKEQKESIRHVPDYFLVDIRAIPKSLALRPNGQSGASVYGFDNALVISRAFRFGAIEIFEFVHEDGESPGVTRAEIVPMDDPFLEVVESFLASDPPD